MDDFFGARHRRHHARIVTDPDISVGKPTVKETRIPVSIVLEHLAHHFDLDTLFADYPRLTRDDVRACLIYAADQVESPRNADARPPA